MATKAVTTKTGWNGAFQALTDTWNQMLKNPEPAYVLVGVSVVLYLIGLAFGGSANRHVGIAGAYGGGDFDSLAALIFALALPVYVLAMARGKKISIDEFMRFDARKFFFVIFVTILMAAIFFVSVLALIVPIVWTVGWFSLAVYAVVDQNKGPVEALKESKRISENNKGKVWGVIGVSVLVSIVAGFLSYIPVVGAAAVAVVNILSAGMLARLYLHLKG